MNNKYIHDIQKLINFSIKHGKIDFKSLKIVFKNENTIVFELENATVDGSVHEKIRVYRYQPKNIALFLLSSGEYIKTYFDGYLVYDNIFKRVSGQREKTIERMYKDLIIQHNLQNIEQKTDCGDNII